MFALLPTLTAWFDEDRPVVVARMLGGHGLAGREAAPVAAWVPGGEPVGSPVAARAAATAPDPDGPVLVEVTLDDPAAAEVGLACGGHAQVLVQRAADLPATSWADLRAGAPVGLVDRPGTGAATVAFGRDDVPERFARVFGRGTSAVVEVGEEVLTTYWPRPHVLVVGGGPVAVAITAQAGLLGWSAAVVDDVAGATAALARLGPADAAVVLSHDRDVDGPVLAAAVASAVGYVGAMGSRATQAARRDWFAAHGVTGTERVHGPAGLDIGGYGPAEIALSVLAEVVAVRTGSADSTRAPARR